MQLTVLTASHCFPLVLLRVLVALCILTTLSSSCSSEPSTIFTKFSTCPVSSRTHRTTPSEPKVAPNTNPFGFLKALPRAARSFASCLPSCSKGYKMAWRCSGPSNSALIQNLWDCDLITDPRVKEAFLKVDRAHYSPNMPYEDSPQSIGYAATISAPHMHASAIENVLPYLIPDPSAPHTATRRVLDVGSGSGYLTHVMAELVGERGLTVGLEHIQELRDLGEANMKKSAEGRSMLDTGKVKFRVGDGRKGLVEPARAGEEAGGQGWDVIHVGAAAKQVHPELMEQLKSPGCMFIPVDDDTRGFAQTVWRIEKDASGNVTKKRLFGVRYVPLTDAPRPI